jgi:hypothetical protein
VPRRVRNNTLSRMLSREAAELSLLPPAQICAGQKKEKPPRPPHKDPRQTPPRRESHKTHTKTSVDHDVESNEPTMRPPARHTVSYRTTPTHGTRDPHPQADHRRIVSPQGPIPYQA